MSLEGVGTPNIETSSGESSQPASTANSALAQQVFGLFKDYLSTQLDAKEKKIETKQKIYLFFIYLFIDSYNVQGREQ